MNFSRRSLLSAATVLTITPAAASGAADQTRELQSAIDGAAAGDGVLRLPAGVYPVSGLRIPSSLQLEGVSGHTVLSAKPGTTILTIENAKHVNISGITFEGGDNGLVLRNSGGRICGTEFRQQEKAALHALDSKGLEISGNHVHDIGNNGIQVWTSEKAEDGTLVTNNRVERVAARDGGSGQNGNGINVYRAGHVLVSNNRVTDCAYSAIRNNSGSNCLVSGNSISRTLEVAIYVEFAFEGVVVCNNVIDDVAFGISIHGGTTEGVKSAGGIYAEADTLIANNVIDSARDFGIGMGWGPYCRNLSAQGNLIQNCATGITASVTTGAGQSYIAHNIIAGAKTAAIVGMDHLDVKTEDLGRAQAKVPDQILLAGNIIRT
jgi:type III secretion system FlhB-like substrate exporter